MGLPSALRSRYTVLRELPNPGTEADVLLVRDTDAGPGASGRDLNVVKVYRRGMHADQAVWAKVQALRSDNIVRFVETGTSGGRDYEVMEYLPGGNLTQLAAGSGQLPLSTVTEVVRQVAGGLAELHRLGIVHRDLKPENVLVRERVAGRRRGDRLRAFPRARAVGGGGVPDRHPGLPAAGDPAVRGCAVL